MRTFMTGEILQFLIGAIFVIIGSLIAIRFFKMLYGNSDWINDRSPEEERQNKKRRWRW
jgi:hypothetical protein